MATCAPPHGCLCTASWLPVHRLIATCTHPHGCLYTSSWLPAHRLMAACALPHLLCPEEGHPGGKHIGVEVALQAGWQALRHQQAVHVGGLQARSGCTQARFVRSGLEVCGGARQQSTRKQSELSARQVCMHATQQSALLSHAGVGHAKVCDAQQSALLSHAGVGRAKVCDAQQSALLSHAGVGHAMVCDAQQSALFSHARVGHAGAGHAAERAALTRRSETRRSVTCKGV